MYGLFYIATLNLLVILLSACEQIVMVLPCLLTNFNCVIFNVIVMVFYAFSNKSLLAVLILFNECCQTVFLMKSKYSLYG